MASKAKRRRGAVSGAVMTEEQATSYVKKVRRGNEGEAGGRRQFCESVSRNGGGGGGSGRRVYERRGTERSLYLIVL